MEQRAESCKSCRFFGRDDVFPETRWQSASCLRHAPVTQIKVVIGYTSDEGHPVWPMMHGDGWCGDWQLNPGWRAKYLEWLAPRRSEPQTPPQSGE